MSDQKLEQIRLETEQDDELRLIMNHTKLGWLNYINSIPQKAKDSRSELPKFGGFLLFRDRIAIPGKLRSEILETIHVCIWAYRSAASLQQLLYGGLDYQRI